MIFLSRCIYHFFWYCTAHFNFHFYIETDDISSYINKNEEPPMLIDDEKLAGKLTSRTHVFTQNCFQSLHVFISLDSCMIVSILYL